MKKQTFTLLYTGGTYSTTGGVLKTTTTTSGTAKVNTITF